MQSLLVQAESQIRAKLKKRVPTGALAGLAPALLSGMMHTSQLPANLYNTSHSRQMSNTTLGTSRKTSQHAVGRIIGKIEAHFFGKTVNSRFSKLKSGRLYSSPTTLCQCQSSTPDCCIRRNLGYPSRFKCLTQPFSFSSSASRNRVSLVLIPAVVQSCYS